MLRATLVEVLPRQVFDGRLLGSCAMARDDAAADPTRREFFRTFGRQTVRNAGAVVGAAAELRRASGQAARELLDLHGPGGGTVVDDPDAAAPWEPAFSSAYRLSDGALLILDQRDLPGRASIVTCREPSEVAAAIRLGVVTPGPVTGELAAYAIAFAPADETAKDAAGVDQVIHAAANTLRTARPDVHSLSAAADRMEARYLDLASGPPTDRRAIGTSLRAEADAIAAEAQLAHAALGRAGAEAVGAIAAREPINLLVHADMGPLSCGMVGTGSAILQSLMDKGHSVHVWLTEAAPTREGARIGAFQLTQMDVPHTVIPDTAVSWLFATRKIDAALLRGDTIAPSGETLSPIGSLNVAQLAELARVPVYVVAPPSSFAAPEVDLSGLLFDVRSPSESGVRRTGEVATQPLSPEFRLAPTTDLVSPRLVTAFITDGGSRPPRSS